MTARTGAAPMLMALVVLAAACTGDDPPATPEPVAAETAEVAPTPEAPAAPSPEPAAEPRLPANGVWLVEAATGDWIVLYESETRLSNRLLPGIAFTPDGTGVWISPRGAGSLRLALDGSILDRIEDGWGVVESPFGPARAYWLIEDGEPTRDLVIEQDGAAVRTTGRASSLAWDPSGRRVAFIDFSGTRTSFGPVGRLTVVDIESGAARVLASGLEPCECGGTPGAVWSPSGRYVTYVDFGDKTIDGGGEVITGDDAGTYVVEVASGEVQHLSQNPRDFAYFSRWLPGEDTLVMTRGGTVSLLDVVTGGERVLAEFEGDAVAWIDPLGRGLTVVVTPLGPPYSTTIIALALPDGRELDRWHDRGLVVWTADGPAIAINAYRGGVPCGVIVHHPILGEERCIEGTLDSRWSSDGRYLALFGRAREGEYVGDEYHEWWRVTILDTIDGHLTIVADDQLPSQPTIRWNEAGTHFLVIWPSGP